MRKLAFFCQFDGICINNLETERPLRHFTDQPTEATISKFGSSVLYSIRTKMGIIKSGLIKAYIKQTTFFSLSALYFKALFHFNPFKTVLILPMRAVFINTIIKTGKTLALRRTFPLIYDRTKLIMQVFTTIEFSSGFDTVY